MKRWILPLLALLVFGCDQPAPEAPPEKSPPVTDPVEEPTEPTAPEKVKTTVVNEGKAPLVHEPITATEPFVRPRRRLNVDQIDAAIRRATGGIGWDLNGNNRFVQLAATLGKPDFREVVQEDLSPTPVFQKFLNDAARYVCTELVQQELEAEPAERVLITYIDPKAKDGPEIDQNLSYLLLRYHGVTLAPDAPELERWRWLFRSVIHLTDEPSQAWRAVCVALITHPDFFSY